MFRTLILCFLSYFVAAYNDGPAASFIKPCKLSDDACVLNSAQAAIPFFADGIPDLGVAPMDPLVLNDVKSNEGDLQLEFKKFNVAGLRNCKFTKISVKSDISHLDFDLECPITATGKYAVGGKLLIVPIEGEGDFEIKTEKIGITLKAKLDNVDGADGKKHWHIVSYEYDYTPKEQVYFRLDNLFNGDEEKAQAVNTVLNHSWEDVIKSIGKPIIKEIVAAAKEVIDAFLKAVAAEKLHIAEKI